MAGEPEIFKVLGWNGIFYSDRQDTGPDVPWVDLLVGRTVADDRDIRDARSWNKRFLGLLYNVADRMPWIVNVLPDPHMKNTLQQANRYFENHHRLAEEARALVKSAVSEAWRDRVPVCLIGHSLGSVIAFDALWELDHIEHSRAAVDLFLTLGSPLGSQYVKHRILGAGYDYERRFPGNIRTWVNLPAVGDHISLDRDFEEEFADMLEIGAVREILQPTQPMYNLFRDETGLNPHRSYGYLAHRDTGDAIRRWWERAQKPEN